MDVPVSDGWVVKTQRKSLENVQQSVFFFFAAKGFSTTKKKEVRLKIK